MDFLKGILPGLVDSIIYVFFTIPVFIGILIFFIGGFSKGGLFSFYGRLNRKLYIRRLFIFFGFSVSAVSFFYSASYYDSTYLFILGIVLFVIGLLYNIANTVKRLHDMNMSGWWVLAICIISVLAGQLPEAADLIINIGIEVALLSIKGTTGSNKYGEDPLENKLGSEKNHNFEVKP